MMKKHISLIQIIVWFTAILMLIFSLYQLHGDAKVINYTGIIRGGTQRLVKQEIFKQADDQLIQRLDNIILELQTGKGENHLIKLTGGSFQDKLNEMQTVWSSIQSEIMLVRDGKDPMTLYEISESYFDLTNEAVSEAERLSNTKLIRTLILLAIYMGITSLLFLRQSKRNQKEMKQMFYTDHVTGIDNHIALLQKARTMLGKGYSYAVIYMDIDGFKYINDIYGYPFGDQVLLEIAHQLHAKYPAVAHLEADNFMLLADPEENFEESLRNFLQLIIKEKFSDNVSKTITYSMGIYVSAPDETADAADILDKSEIAHKQCGNTRSATIWYNDELIEKLTRESRMEKELTFAIERKELQVYLQPKISLRNDDMGGAEALVRWNSSTLGRLMPDEFIPHFESNGMIYQIDFYMLEQVCRLIQQHDWLKHYCISINFSRITLNLDNFYELFHRIIDAFQIPYEQIELEITEGIFQEVSSSLHDVINRLKKEGFHISIDDFGSGYSSLNMLTDFPADILKLDRNFLTQNIMSKDHEALISCIIQMAHLLHFKVICEGVETKEHVNLLKDLGCDQAQGYFYARPMSANDFIKSYTPYIHDAGKN